MIGAQLGKWGWTVSIHSCRSRVGGVGPLVSTARVGGVGLLISTTRVGEIGLLISTARVGGVGLLTIAKPANGALTMVVAIQSRIYGSFVLCHHL